MSNQEPLSDPEPTYMTWGTTLFMIVVYHVVVSILEWF